MRSTHVKNGPVRVAEEEKVAAGPDERILAEAEAVAEPVAEPGAPAAVDIAEAMKDLEAGLINLREQKRQHDLAGQSLEERIWQQEGAIKFARLLQRK